MIPTNTCSRVRPIRTWTPKSPPISVGTWPMPFIHKYYLPEGAKFIMAYDNWEKDYESKKNQVFVFDYEFNLQATKEPRSADGRLIELTDDYRSGKKIEFTEN